MTSTGGSGLLRRPALSLFRAAHFRLAAGFALAMLGAIILQFLLIYSQLTSLEFQHSGRLLNREMELLRSLPPDHLDYVIRERATDDLRIVINEAGIFTAAHQPVTGDLAIWPEGLMEDGELHDIVMEPEEGAPYKLRFLATTLPDGRILVLGRSVHLLSEQKLILRRASLTAAVPILLFALLTGIWLSKRAMLRVKDIHEAVDRIMRGDIHERLPEGAQGDDLQLLARSVNRMLDRLEQLMQDMSQVGNDIAHDLRTPLARVRAALERALRGPNSESPEAMREVMARSIENLDQCFAIITALLRMAEIDNGRRRDMFGRVDLGALVNDIIDLYEPIAESVGVRLYGPQAGQVRLDNPEAGDVTTVGDRDLLMEALANLVDNAIKFTPEGGTVRVEVGFMEGRSALAVVDSGIGVPPAERGAVFTRFYRSDKSRHIPGSGLGLSVVASILRLHNAVLSIEDADPGHPERGAGFVTVFPARADGGDSVSESF